MLKSLKYFLLVPMLLLTPLIVNAQETPILGTTDPVVIQEFMTSFFTGAFSSNAGEWWQAHSVDLLIYVLAPLIFLIILLYVILTEIQFFDNEKIRFVIALLLGLIAIPTGIYSGLIFFLANLGAVMSVTVFFALLLGLGLSRFYTKKARDFKFLLGSRFLTIYIIHLPLIILFIIVGAWLGGMAVENGFLFSSFVLSGPDFIFGMSLIQFIAVLIVLAAGIALIFSYKTEWIWVLLTVAITLAFLIFPSAFGSDPSTESIMFGVGLGLALGHMYVWLEKGRKYGLSNILSEGQTQIKPLKKELQSLKAVIKKLEKEKAGGGFPKNIKYTGQYPVDLPQAEITDVDEEIKHLQKIRDDFQTRIKEIENHLRDNVLKELYS